MEEQAPVRMRTNVKNGTVTYEVLNDDGSVYWSQIVRLHGGRYPNYETQQAARNQEQRAYGYIAHQP